MKQTVQQWSFTPLSLPTISVDSKSITAMTFCVGFVLLGLEETYPNIIDRLMLFLCVLGVSWLVRHKWKIWRWYRCNHEYLRLDDTSLHFCIYPRSGSLKYWEILQVVHWYEERIDEYENVYDKDIGMILTTTQGEVKLNLERIMQSDDDIIFDGSSHIVVIHELNKRIRAFQAA